MPSSSVVFALVAVDLVGVEPPLLAGGGLPLGEEPVDVRVQQEDKRIFERGVDLRDRAGTEETVSGIV